jgi:hypothetical protein
MCPEFPTEELDRELVRRLFDAAQTSGRALALLHAGYVGAASPIHFDWDFRWVLHLNLSGRKRLAIGHPDLGCRSQVLINSLPYDLTRLPRDQQRRLFRWLGAESHVLGPGEGIIFPPLWWHAARYDRPSLSLSFRFDEAVALRPIAALPRSGRLQRVAWILISAADDDLRTTTVDEIVRAFFRSAPSWIRRYRTFMADLLQIETRLRSSLALESAAEVVPEHLNAERHVARDELKTAFSWSVATAGEADPDETERISHYLFEGRRPSSLEMGERLELARYAVVKRQGLPPVRGVVLRDERHP